VAAALRAAQLDRLGAEPQARIDTWAGFVVLGDGDLVPFPGGRHPWPSWLPPTPAGVALCALVLGAFLALVALAVLPSLRAKLGRLGGREARVSPVTRGRSWPP
jgi:hypothetical protein